MLLGALASDLVGMRRCSGLVFRRAFAFYELPARAWEFAAGGILALAGTVMPSARTRLLAVAGGIVGAAMILGTVCG